MAANETQDPQISLTDEQILSVLKSTGQLAQHLGDTEPADHETIKPLVLAARDGNFERLARVTSERLQHLLIKYDHPEEFRWGRVAQAELRRREREAAARDTRIGWRVSALTGELAGVVTALLVAHFMKG